MAIPQLPKCQIVLNLSHLWTGQVKAKELPEPWQDGCTYFISNIYIFLYEGGIQWQYIAYLERIKDDCSIKWRLIVQQRVSQLEEASCEKKSKKDGRYISSKFKNRL